MINVILLIILSITFFYQPAEVRFVFSYWEVPLSIILGLLLLFNIKNLRIPIVVILFFLIIIINSVSMDHYHSSYALIGSLVSLTTWLYFYNNRGENNLTIFLYFVLAEHFLSIILYFNYPIYLPFGFSLEPSGFAHDMFIGLFRQENSQTFFSIISLYVLIFNYETFKTIDSKLRIYGFTVGITVFSILLAYQSKFNLIAMLCSVVCWYFVNKFSARLSSKANQYYGVSIIILLTIGMLAFVNIIDIEALSSRKVIWDTAFEMGLSNISGVGLGKFSYYWNDYYTFGDSSLNHGIAAESAHNIWLSIWAELGIIGLCSFSALFFIPYFKILKNLNVSIKARNTFVLYVFIFISTFGTTSTWVQPGPRVLLCAILGYSWFHWGVRFKPIEKFDLKYKSLAIFIIVLSLFFSSYYHYRFIRSEEIYYKSLLPFGLNIDNMKRIIAWYPFSAPGQFYTTLLMVQAGEKKFSQEKIALVKDISGQFYKPSDLSLSWAKKFGSDGEIQDALENYIKRYPVGSLKLQNELLNSYKNLGDCKAFLNYKRDIYKWLVGLPRSNSNSDIQNITVFEKEICTIIDSNMM